MKKGDLVKLISNNRGVGIGNLLRISKQERNMTLKKGDLVKLVNTHRSFNGGIGIVTKIHPHSDYVGYSQDMFDIYWTKSQSTWVLYEHDLTKVSK